MTTQPQVFEYAEDNQTDWMDGDEQMPEKEENLDAEKLNELKQALEQTTEKKEDKKEDEDTSVDDAFVDKVTKALEKRFGLSIDDIVSVLSGADEIVRQNSIQQQEQELRELWGDENFDANMAAVAERFAKLPPDLQDKYDNVEGAKLLWALVQQEQSAKDSRKAKPQRDTVRFIQGGKQAPGQNASANMFKMSELLEMSQEDYQKNLPLIEAAFRENRVINDVS